MKMIQEMLLRQEIIRMIHGKIPILQEMMLMIKEMIQEKKMMDQEMMKLI